MTTKPVIGTFSSVGDTAWTKTDGTQLGSVNGTTGAWTLGDTTNAAFPGNLIVGKKDGSAIASGFVGQVIDLTGQWPVTTLTANTDISINNINSNVLPAGFYLIQWIGQTSGTATGTTGLEAILSAGSTVAGGTGLNNNVSPPPTTVSSGRDTPIISTLTYYVCTGVSGNVAGTGQFSLQLRSNGATNTLYGAPIGRLRAIRIA